MKVLGIIAISFTDNIGLLSPSKTIKEIQTKSQIGANNIKLNLGELASGVYSIQIFENSQLTQVSKIEKK